MKLFLDTGDIKLIEEGYTSGMIDGVTTNPSIIASSGQDIYTTLKEICNIVKTSVSAEVVATEYEEMLQEAEKLLTLGSQIVIKLPLTWHGLRACNTLSRAGHKVNMTLCFSVNQALLAAKAGAAYISVFAGRLDDIGHDGLELITNTCHMLNNYASINSETLAASIRSPVQVMNAALAGAHIATIPPKVFEQMYKHPLTDLGLEKFLEDWRRSKQKI
jgi:transaldolase